VWMLGGGKAADCRRPPLARERERTLWTEQTKALTALGVAARICWQAKL
jgi:hypothetical protein